MRDILLLEIINKLLIMLLIFTAFLWHLLQLHFQLHFMRWASLSCLELCKPLSWAAFVILNKETTHLLTYEINCACS